MQDGLTRDDWYEYYQAMLSKPLHPHYQNLDPHLPNGGEALDLGCGVGQGVVHLLEKGFKVTAVDVEEAALGFLKERLPKDANCTIIHSSFQDFVPRSYDVVVAHFALFFLSPDEFKAFWPKVANAVRPGGILSTQLLGVNDTWVERGYNVHTKDDVHKLLGPFEILYEEEVDRDGETAVGTKKHWHVFHIVARKK